MNDSPSDFLSVSFAEHAWKQQSAVQVSDFDICFNPPFSSEKYSSTLFNRVLNIDLNELSDFLDYQCNSLKLPIKWLDSLEMLIDKNVTSLVEPALKQRYKELILQIDKKRSLLQAISLGNFRHDLLSKYSEQPKLKKKFSFESVQEHLAGLASPEEKLQYLHLIRCDHKQESLTYNTNGSAFDGLCEIEIQKVESQEASQLKAKQKIMNETGAPSIPVKARIHGKLNFFIDIFFQLMHDFKINGKPFLESSNKQIAMIICNNFLDKNGKDITIKSVMTILEVNRPEKRPKDDRRFNLE
jgi:hypothetical protein